MDIALTTPVAEGDGGPDGIQRLGAFSTGWPVRNTWG